MSEVITALPASCLLREKTYTHDFFRAQLEKLPLEDTLFMCAKLNLLYTNGHYLGVPIVQDTILKLLAHQHWLDTSDISRMRKYASQRGQTIEQNPFVTRIHCLEMMRWLSLWSATRGGGVVNDFPRKHGFARSMLMAFEVWANRTQMRVWKDQGYEALADEDQQFQSLRIMREASIWSLPSFNPYWQFGRAHELYLDEFFAHNNPLRLNVENSVRMPLDDYVNCVIALSSLPNDWFSKSGTSIADNFDFAPAGLCDNAPHMTATVESFIAQESVDSARLQKSFKSYGDDPARLTDLLPLRQRPIITVGGGYKATFIDLILFMERASNGLLFKASRIIGDQAMVEFGHAFERYAIKRLDRYVTSLKAKGIEVTTIRNPKATAKDTGEEGEFSDYLIVRDRRMILIEIKGKWLQDKSVGRTTAEEYWQDIYAKYVVEESEGKPKRKGVSQLADSINGWLDGRLELKSDIVPTDVDEVIPVLLVWDGHLTSQFHAKFLAREFQKLIPGTGDAVQKEFQLRKWTILNLCLISIDEFEDFENRVLTRGLEVLLREYSYQVPDRSSSAGMFLAQLKSDPFPPQPGIVSESEAALDRACERLFGTAGD